MRIISAPARAECELVHRFFSTMPPAKHSQRINEAGEPEEQAGARDINEAAALLFDLGIGELGKAPSASRASPPRRLR
jgi:hypothetical protein